MQIVPDGIGGGSSAAEERFAGPLGFRSASRRDLGGLPSDPDSDLHRSGSVSLGSALDKSVPSQPSTLFNELSTLSQPVFAPPAWGDPPLSSLPVADHPLLRGLMLELPPRDHPMPSADWLDRWFEATRSVLELIYAQDEAIGSARH